MLITVCSYCSRYRDKLGTWQVHNGTLDPRSLTHGVCDACLEDEYRKLHPVKRAIKRSKKRTPETNEKQTYELVM